MGTSAAIGDETRLELYRQQLRVRHFEKRAYDLFLLGLVKGTSHLSLGQEAIAAGVGAALKPTDYVFATYRGHAHGIVKGVSMSAMMAELLSRSTGLMGGKGGSMHLTSVEHGFMGSYAIVGAHLPIAAGSAWSSIYRGTDQVTVCFFGDGTTNIGAFHEALNLSAVWKLPVVFVCENNQYMEYTPIGSVTAVARPAADRASAYGLEGIVVDGNDPEAVYMVALDAVQQARQGAGPSLIEALTYRHGGHSRADPGKYRPEGEILEWMAKDPIPRYRSTLTEMGFPDVLLDDIETTVRAEVDAATDAAKAAPFADPATTLDNLWADGGSSWRN